MRLTLLIPLTVMIAVPAHAQTMPAPPAPANNPQVDYSAFLKLTEKLAGYREKRLISLTAFNEKRSEDNTVILDTRSAAAFKRGHIDGAINIPFSDFTDEKLEHILGKDNSRKILIYCNNNFLNDIAPVMVKRAPLALNIPTFINLYGYGYQNVYELSGSYDLKNPELNWVSS